jgi:hypothetical protein
MTAYRFLNFNFVRVVYEIFKKLLRKCAYKNLTDFCHFLDSQLEHSQKSLQAGGISLTVSQKSLKILQRNLRKMVNLRDI